MKRLTLNSIEELGPALKKIRLKKKLKMVPLQKSCNISISSISLIEQGKQYPRLHTLINYAQTLGVDEILIKIPKNPEN
jgi:transcriptional regulator with XRE-family HTH domain